MILYFSILYYLIHIYIYIHQLLEIAKQGFMANSLEDPQVVFGTDHFAQGMHTWSPSQRPAGGKWLGGWYHGSSFGVEL